MTKPYYHMKPLLFSICLIGLLSACQSTETTEKRPPNILFAISDDQSFPYTGAYGATALQTPAFDEVAKRGVLFRNAFCAAPQCSPSRAAILTGRNIWQLEEAGTHSSYFPKKFPVFTQALGAAGYALGYTGKPWGPGNWKDAGWETNPVGPAYNEVVYENVPNRGINKRNYAANFALFLQQKEANKPFFFWYGCHEPHRVFEEGAGQKAGKKLAEAQVPTFLPNDTVIQNDILDYNLEIEWFDQHLGQMLALLEEAGELDNTIIIITSDNGMAFPYAKANLQEYGTHVPLAIAGPGINGGRTVEELVSLIDIAPTLLDITENPGFDGITGQSLRPLLSPEEVASINPPRPYVLTGRERHTHARPDNLGYPARAIRTADYLYIHNFAPDRWPAGDPAVVFPEGHESDKRFKSMVGGYHDIDPSPSKSHILDAPTTFPDFYRWAVSKRPAEELFNIKTDPGCTKSLVTDPAFDNIRQELKAQLFEALKQQGDPRALGKGDIFESYPRFASMREFPGFNAQGVYNPAYGKERLED